MAGAALLMDFDSDFHSSRTFRSQILTWRIKKRLPHFPRWLGIFSFMDRLPPIIIREERDLQPAFKKDLQNPNEDVYPWKGSGCCLRGP